MNSCTEGLEAIWGAAAKCSFPSAKFLALITTVLLPKPKRLCHNTSCNGWKVLGWTQCKLVLLHRGTTATGVGCSSPCKAAAAVEWKGIKRKQTWKKGFCTEMYVLHSTFPRAETIWGSGFLHPSYQAANNSSALARCSQTPMVLLQLMAHSPGPGSVSGAGRPVGAPQQALVPGPPSQQLWDNQRGQEPGWRRASTDSTWLLAAWSSALPQQCTSQGGLQGLTPLNYLHPERHHPQRLEQ